MKYDYLWSCMTFGAELDRCDVLAMAGLGQ